MRKAFNFYRSYYDVAKELPEKERLLFLMALLERQFEGTEPNLTGMAKLAYISQKHSIDSQISGYETKTGSKINPTVGGTVGATIPPCHTPAIQEKEKGEEEGEEKGEEEGKEYSFDETSSSERNIDFPSLEELAFMDNNNLKADSKTNDTTNHLKADKPKKEKTVYTSCCDAYNDFIISEIGVPAKFDGQEGKAMKAIITYLTSASTDKSDKGITETLRFVLNAKTRWDPFHQNQLKLSQINTNLINILKSIKNGTAKQSTNLYDQSKYRS